MYVFSHDVDLMRQVLPGSANVRDPSLTSKSSFRSNLKSDTRHLVGEHAQTTAITSALLKVGNGTVTHLSVIPLTVSLNSETPPQASASVFFIKTAPMDRTWLGRFMTFRSTLSVRSYEADISNVKRERVRKECTFRIP